MTILAILSRVPYPLEKGDKLRVFHLLKHLGQNHDIVLFCLNDTTLHPDAINQLSTFCKSIHICNISKLNISQGIINAFIKGLPLQTGYFYNKSAKRKLDKIINEIKPDHIFCQLVRVAEYVKNIDIPKTIDYQDVFSKGMKRRADISPWYLKPLFLLEYKRLHKYENRIFDMFDNKIIISKPDRDLIPHHLNKEITVIPNGIDTDFFKPSYAIKEYDILFTGNMSYLPNVISAEMLVKEILPLLHKKDKTINLLLAGANPSARVMSLKSKNVTVSGWVEDIRSCYNKSSIFVAPMQIGTGLQNKLLESMAMGMPCVTSKLANTALGAKENEEIIVCEKVSEYVDAIWKLKNDKDFFNKIAIAGQSYVAKNYKWDVQAKILENIIKSTVKTCKTR